MIPLLDLPYEGILQEWDERDDHGRNEVAIASLCLLDRFYLLVKVCRRVDAMHPWIYARCREVESGGPGCLDRISGVISGELRVDG